MLAIRRYLASALFATGLLRPAHALAQVSSGAELSWRAPEGCPSESEVRARVQKLAGSAKSSSASLRAEGTVTRSEDGEFHLELVVHAGALVGSRKIDGKSCSDLAGAAAVALALLLNSDAPLSADTLGAEAPNPTAAPNGSSSSSASPPTTSPTRDPQSPRESPPHESRALEPTRSPAPDAASARHFFIQLPIGALGVGQLPHPSFGFGLAAGVVGAGFRLSLRAEDWLGQHLDTTYLLDSYRADLSRQSLALSGCRAFPASGFELAPCVLLSLERLSARGTGPGVAPRASSQLWPAFGLGLQARLRISAWFGLFSEIAGELEASAPQVTIDGVGDIGQRFPRAAATITVGPEWIL